MSLLTFSLSGTCKSLFLTLITFVLITNFAVAQTDYFWVGEGLSSDWTDDGNWSDVSGGTGGFGVPGNIDNALFDANSFTTTFQSVEVVTGTVSVGDMTWTNIGFNPQFVINPGATLSVAGTFALSSDMFLDNQGQLLLSSSAGGSNNITFAGQTLGNIRFENPTFDDQDPLYTTWVLQDNMSGTFIVVADGANLTTQFGFVSITATDGMSFTSFADGDLGFSFIDLDGNWINQSGDINFESTTIQINVEGTGGGSYSFDGGGDTYGTVILAGAHDFSISGSNSFNQLLINNQANAQFAYFYTQTVNSLIAVGNETQTVGLRSDDPFSGTPIIDLGSTGSASVFFAELEAIEVQGINAPYAAISSTDLGNNVGWNFVEFFYAEDFEDNDGSWTAGGTSPSWDYGASDGNIPSSDGVWGTNRAGEFNSGEASYIQSPTIDLSGLTTPTITLSLFEDMSTEEFQGEFLQLTVRDMAYLEYSTDGSAYLLAGSADDSDWYTLDVDDPSVTINSIPVFNDGWNRATPDWNTYTLQLPEVAGESTVTFRLVFATDATDPTGRQGIALDEFFIFDADASSNQTFDLESDSLALVALYNATDGPNWTNQTGWEIINGVGTPEPLENWFGVTVSANRVTSLILGSDGIEIADGNGLNGTIPTDIGNLTELTTLNLSYNYDGLEAGLSGVLPSEIGNLSKLQTLNLQSNRFSGSVPKEIGQLSSLVSLNLDDNAFSGTIPSELGNLSLLQLLTLSNNDNDQGQGFNGSIPTELSNLSALETLDLSSNSLSGTIPSLLGNLSALNNLDLSSNSLTGEIPSSIGNLTNLTDLSINSNQLSGSIPSELGNLINLKDFDLYDNQLTGSLPTELGNLTALQSFEIDENQLSGTIPASLGNLTQLTEFWLEINQFTGPIPTFLGNFSNLSTLRIGSNNWDATDVQNLFTLIEPLNNLADLDLANANVFGVIPAAVGDFSFLSDLELNDNNLTGQIPEEIINLSLLRDLRLANNGFSGTVPLAFTTMTALQDFDISGNSSLCEPEDASYATWTATLDSYVNDEICLGAEPVLESDSLALVALYNSTNGAEWTNNTNWLVDGQNVSTWFGVTVSGGRVTSIDLSNPESLDTGTGNNMIGFLPNEIGDLTALELLIIGSGFASGNSSNDLSGGVLPITVGNLTNLTFLQLVGNGFVGAIPNELSNLTSLTDLYLTNNDFDPAAVPDYITSFPLLTDLFLDGNNLNGNIPDDIGNLSELNRLGLSSNQLDGNLPNSFYNLTALNYLSLGFNQLSGTITEDIQNLSSLTHLDVYSNSFSGAIPTTLVSLTNLTYLRLALNEFSGSIISGLGGLSNLAYLDLGSNSLTGNIPSDIVNSNLQTLDLRENELEGEIPSSFNALTNLNDLFLFDNRLSGTIPAIIGSLSNLRRIWIQNNEFVGNIPAELSNLSSLEELLISNNLLSGIVPEEFTDLSALTIFQLGSNSGLCEPNSSAYLDWAAELSNYDNSETCINNSETCENAQILVGSGNYLATSAPYWYTYTAGDDDELITISSAGTTVDTDLDVYDACDGIIIAENDDIDVGNNIFQSELTFLVNANTTIYINWRDTYETTGFNWTLSSQTAPTVFLSDERAYSVSATQVAVRWTDLISDASTTYTVERSENTEDNFVELSPIDIRETDWRESSGGPTTEKYFFDESVSAGIEYFYRITAKDQFDLTFLSEVVSATPVDHGFELNTSLYQTQVLNEVKALAWGDYNGDGFEDLFAGQFVNANDASLLLNNIGDGTFSDEATLSGFPFTQGEDNVRAAAWADFNNDGLLDMIASSIGDSPFLSIIINTDGGSNEIIINEGLNSWPVALGDFNNDRLVDFVTSDPNNSQILIYLSDLSTFLTGELNHYSVNTLTTNNGFQWSIATGDLEGDGDIDLFVPNVGEFNDQLFRNNGNGEFEEIQVPGLTDQPFNHRGAQFLDVDNDGDEDIYVSSSSGDRFYINDGFGGFTRFALGLTEASRSAAVEDFDNDGDRDLILAQGTPIYWENEGGSFSSGQTIGNFEVAARGTFFVTSASPADYNNDGFVDVAMGGEAPSLFANSRTLNGSNNFLKVKLDSRRVNFSGIGAKIKVTGTGSGTMTRVLKGQTGAEAHSSLIKHFGLSSSSTADVTVEWPDGRVSNFSGVAANQTFVVEDFTDRDLDSLEVVKLYMAYDGPNWPNQENWFSGTLDTWQGVIVNFNRVTGIDISDNEITGDFTFDLSGLTALDSIRLAGNEFTSIPNFSFTSLNKVDVSDNLLVFDDIQPTIDGGYMGDYLYSPQKPFGDAQSITLTQGQSSALAASINFVGPVTYQWNEATEAVPDSTNATYQIVGATAADAGTYYVEVQNANVPGLTLQSADITVSFSVNSPADVAALTNLYNATAGIGWTNNTGWTIEPDLGNWFGVTTNDLGQVSQLNLSNNNLVGEVPIGFANIVNATSIDLSENVLSDLPDLSAIGGLFNLDISQNNLLFDAIIPNADIPGVNYSPQNPLGQANTILANVVDTVTISTGIDFMASDNIYTWKLNGNVVEGATDANYEIVSILPEDAGIYILEVTNPSAPDLTLVSEPITLEVTEFWPINEADSVMLLNIYNDLGGSNWNNNSRWVTDSVTYWQGVKLYRGAVSSLSLPNNNLVGDFPPLITGSFESLDTLILSGNQLTAMPTDFTNADQLRLLNLSNNNITVLPDSTGLDSLRAVFVGNNSLFFSELEPFVNLSTFDYLPQAPLSGDSLIFVDESAALTISYPVTGSGLTYSWQKDGENFANPNDATLSIPSYRVADNGVYNLTVSSNIITDLVFSTGNIALRMNNSQADSLFLVSIYEEMGGINWVNSEGWLDQSIDLWNGITVEEGKVVSIELVNNNLTGSFPGLSGLGLSEIQELNISGNRIETLSQLGSLSSLNSVDVSNNLLQFGSLENQLRLDEISYTPQKTLFDTLQVVQEVGTSFTIGRTVTGTANQYSWTKGDESFEESTAQITFSDVAFESDAIYQLSVTNGDVIGLTLTTAPIVVLIASLERDIATLQQLFDELGGTGWSVSANWRDNPIDQPEVILNEQGTRVIGLNLSGVGLVGDVPESILSMTELEFLDLSENQIESVPRLLEIENLETLDISGNSLEYQSIQENLEAGVVDFDDQDPITPDTLVIRPQGTEVTLLARLSGSLLNYQWYFNNEIIEGATTETLVIDSLNFEDMGFYYCEITNSEVLQVNEDFSLRTGSYEVLATANIVGELRDVSNASVQLGEVTLYEVTPIGTPYIPVDTVVVTDNTFVFEDAILDDYVIRGLPDDTVYIPTYHRDGVTFDQADTILLRQDVDNKNVFFQFDPPELLPGPDNQNLARGFLEIEEDDFPELFDPNATGRTNARRRVRRAGCGFNRARFVNRAEDDVIFELIAYAETDENGEFRFPNLPDGTYRINFDFPGVPTDPNSFVEFELISGGPLEGQVIELAGLVTRTGIVVEKIEQTGIYLDIISDVKIYPVPTEDQLFMNFNLLSTDLEVKMDLINMNGAVVLRETVQAQPGVNEVAMNMSRLDAGIYIVRISNESDGILHTGKVIKE